MSPPFKMRYYYIGADNKRYLCQFKGIFEKGDDLIYMFLSEDSGDKLLIKKVNGKWLYEDGKQYYLESWIEELGQQIDSGNYE